MTEDGMVDSVTNSMDMNLSKSRRQWRTEEPGVLQSIGSQRVRHDSMTEQKQHTDIPSLLDFPPTHPSGSSQSTELHQKILQNNECWRGCGEKGTVLLCWWECKFIQPLWGIVWRLLKNLNTEVPYDPAVPLPGIYPRKTMIQKDTCTPMFIAVLFTVARLWK